MYMDVINGDPKCASVQNQLQEKMYLKLGLVEKWVAAYPYSLITFFHRIFGI